MTDLVQPRGDHYYKVFHCHGCQTCWEMTEDGGIIQHEHVLGQTDVTKQITEWREAMQEFVDRCDNSEVRSRYTYNKFKKLLG